jgi:hypothetical protein
VSALPWRSTFHAHPNGSSAGHRDLEKKFRDNPLTDRASRQEAPDACAETAFAAFGGPPDWGFPLFEKTEFRGGPKAKPVEKDWTERIYLMNTKNPVTHNGD